MRKYIKFLHNNRVKILWFLCFGAILFLTLSKFDNTPKVPKIENLDKVVHFLMFFAMAFLGRVVIIKTRNDSFPWNIANFVCVCIMGGMIELLQPYFGRECSLMDFVADVAGVFVAVFVTKFIYFKFIKKFLHI